MDIAHPIQVLVFDAEGATNLPVILHAVPERAVVGLETVAAPGSPAFEFA